MAANRAAISSSQKNSPFKLQVMVHPRGVFFDRLDPSANNKLLILQTTPKRARALAQWILDNVEE